MRIRTVLGWAGVVVLAILLLVTVCKVKACAERVPGFQGSRVLGEALIEQVGLVGPVGQEPESELVAPGAKVRPTGIRRPVFGTEESEGIEVEIKRQIAKGKLQNEDTVRIRVGRDGRVTNLGADTLSIAVTRVGPAWIQWDPSGGVCVLAGLGRREGSLVQEWNGLHLDLSGKLKLIDFPLGLTGVELGLPVFYVATSGVGLGVDMKHDRLEFLTLDVAYLYHGPTQSEWCVGVGVGF